MRIAFSLLALSTPIRPAVAQVSAVFSGDERLSAKRSIRAVTTPVRDLLADLTRQTSIAFFADESVMDEPITVIAHDRPLAESLATVCKLAGYEWTRHGEGKASSYTLRLSDATRKEQEAAQAERLQAAADRIRQENEEYFKLAALAEPRRHELATELPAKLAAETDPQRIEQLRLAHAVLSELNEGSSRRNWSPIVRGLVRSLPMADLVKTLEGAAVYYSWPKLPASREFPPEVLRELQQVGRMELGLSGGFRGEIVSLRLRVTGVGARVPYLNWHLTVGQRASQFQSTAGYTASIPSSWSMSAMKAPAPPAPAATDWKSDAAMNVRLTLNLPANPPNSRLDARAPVHRLGEALLALDAAHPINVVADGYWSGHLAGFDARDAPLGEVLDRLSRMCGRDWSESGGFLVVRSRDLFVDRASEPPATQVRRWEAAADQGFFGLEELAEIASLPDAQLMTLQEMAMRGVFPVLYSPLSSGRSHLLLWASLSPSQRRKAQSGGVAYRDLEPAAQLRFILAATDPSARQLVEAPLDETSLTKATLRTSQREASYWGVRRRGTASNARVDRTDSENQPIPREEALKRFRTLDDSIKLEDVQPMVKIGVTFSYDSDRSSLAITYIDLPPRWGDSGPSGLR